MIQKEDKDEKQGRLVFHPMTVAETLEDYENWLLSLGYTRYEIAVLMIGQLSEWFSCTEPEDKGTTITYG